MANSSDIQSRHAKRSTVARHKAKTARAPTNRYLKVSKASLQGELLTVDAADGASLLYRCGSRRPLVPPGRLVYAASTYRSHEEQMRELTRKRRCPFDSPELEIFIAPILKRWAAGRSGLDILELGPAHTTEIPDVLEPSISSYTAVDFSPPFLRKQRELLADNPSLLARSRHIVADTYELSLPKECCDLVVVSCHPPLVSASVEDKILVIDKIHSFLRAKAVFSLFPWVFQEQPALVTQHLLNRFTLSHMAWRGTDTNRLLLFLEKK